MCDIFWERTLDKHDIAFGPILVFDTKINKNEKKLKTVSNKSQRGGKCKYWN